MRTLIKNYRVGAGETDCFNLLKPSSLLYFMQDAATEHADIMGLAREKLVSENSMIWVLARCLIELSHPIRGNDEVTLETWHRGLTGPLWYRDFEISVNGKPAGHAVNVWVIADAVTHKMMKPVGLEKINSLTENPERSLGISIGKLKCSDELSAKYEKLVRYSDMDINCHLNNTKYADLICDAISLNGMNPSYFSKLQINYINECRPGEKIILKCNNEKSFASGVTDDGEEKFAAQFTLNFA